MYLTYKMSKYLPFLLTILIFILVWFGLLFLPYIESISPTKGFAYMTFSLYVAILVFVILASIYRFENINVPREDIKREFTYQYSDLFPEYNQLEFRDNPRN